MAFYKLFRLQEQNNAFLITYNCAAKLQDLKIGNNLRYFLLKTFFGPISHFYKEFTFITELIKTWDWYRDFCHI